MNERSRQQVLIVALAVAYAACFPAIKVGLGFAPPLMLAGIRALLAGVALVLVLVISGRPVLPERESWRWVFLLAATSTTLALGSMFLSPGRTGAGVASVLANLQPVLVLALAVPVLGERITSAKAIALTLGFAGALLVSSSAVLAGGTSDLSGPALALTASVSVAAGNLLAKRMGAQPRLVAIAAWQLILGSLPLLAASAVLERGDSIRWDPRLLAIVLFLALFGTALPTPIWYWLVRGEDDLGQLTLFLFLVPAIGLGLSIALFGEPLNAIELLGTAVILSGIIAATRAEVAPRAGERWSCMPCHCPSLCVDVAAEPVTS